jgi:carbamoyltransferase
MIILGLHFDHDAAATLMKDGEIASVIEAERVTGKKLDDGVEAIHAAVAAAFAQTGIRAEDVAAVAYSDLFFEDDDLPARLDRREDIQAATHGARLAAQLGRFDEIGFNRLIPTDVARLRPDVPVFLTCHSMSHAAGAVYMSGFSEAAGLVIDGYGTCCGMMGYLYRGELLSRLELFRDRYLLGAGYHGIGNLAREIVDTDPLDIAGKVMGLHAYGQPVPAWVEYFRERYFRSSAETGYEDYLRQVSERCDPQTTARFCAELFPGGLRVGTQTVSDATYRDLVSSMQEAFSQIVTRTIEEIVTDTGATNIFISGGCALNIIANAAVAALPQIGSVFVPPNANDSGQAMGCAILAMHAMTGAPVHWPETSLARRRDPYIGAELLDSPGELTLPEGVTRSHFAWDGATDLSMAAHRLIAGEIIGVVRGASEIGPRALGNRSILALASFPEMKDIVNKIKHREWWRPFAPVCRACDAERYFVIQEPSRYMLFNNVVRDAWRDKLASITHQDGTARLQVLCNREDNPNLWDLLTQIANEGSIPVLLNTSFNLSRKPLVNSTAEALNLLLISQMDAAIIGDWFFAKSDAAHINIC